MRNVNALESIVGALVEVNNANSSDWDNNKKIYISNDNDTDDDDNDNDNDNDDDIITK